MEANECLICGAHLEYLDQAIEMECSICHRPFQSNVRCTSGHYVCDECHTRGIDRIVNICMQSSTRNPYEILEQMMSMPTCHMHGPEHHIMVGASLITAYRNAGADMDMVHALNEIISRGKQVPGGVCGNWGACGAGISTGMFVSIVTKSTPLATTAWSLCNLMTSQALAKISQYGGPRCCKRDAYLALDAAIDFAQEKLNVTMDKPTQITCTRSACNNQCIGVKCPFHPTLETK